MKVNELYSILDKWYPFVSQDIWDNSGSFSFFENEIISGVLIGLDVTLDIVTEAIQKNCNVIITHHPIFIDQNDIKKKHIKNIINLLNINKISLFSLHTNFDKNRYGMNYNLLKKLNLTNIKRSKKSDYLFFGELKTKMNINDFIVQINRKIKPDYLIYDKENLFFKENKKIKKVAIVGGSGSGEYENILKKDKIDLFITGEVKWHIWNLSSKSIPIIDVGHSIEKIFIEIISTKIKKLNLNVYEHQLEIKLSNDS
ncbi:Nif3-like dinuclear metal center hexameric protein [Malacoplasma iowae]|uniref:GTP cyclohydrolase 1 type 2 homolog n=2 Tax=Malacoplasma iowae TaxID=2116 RepID=A0A084U462_MALIO|nr:Nif3-like dinuclear metal center hexameric protein [Malacoplasma iowae]VEU61721.1 metal-binding protein [Mycoplasmopsis fermentans]EGZ31364.1 hypothetical protein GUU_02354 [Malacoplasma iowae 695]KFB07748.1 hypothetical protein P271_606 [Malacoplasma iowae DK-CPA]QHG90156.1 Nif3-like dinuclear metal center hexameric protein [Malacoplasma iowae 695]WPL36100.1 Nif3-like dinuclear metal center hexameric protein [Malacoplasma iowae]